MKKDEYPYQIYDRNGRLVMSASESCRYPPKTELSLMEAGHTIKLHGKRITKKELQKK